jgi:hypothetical protein
MRDDSTVSFASGVCVRLVYHPGRETLQIEIFAHLNEFVVERDFGGFENTERRLGQYHSHS